MKSEKWKGVGEGGSTWVVGVKVWYCDGWLVDNPKKERKKQLVKCVVGLLDKLKKERKQATTTLDLQWAWKKSKNKN